MSESRGADRLLRVFRWFRNRGYRIDLHRRRASAALFGQFLRARYGKHVSFQSFEHLSAEHAERWSTPQLLPTQLSIVVVSYKQPMALQCLLSSLASQVLQNFEVLIYHDGPDPETREVAERFCAHSDRFHYCETHQRHNDWGHTLRATGIEAAQGEYLLITNGNNYYVPRFTEFVFDAINSARLDVALWDLVHSYSSPGLRTLRCYTPLRVFPVKYMVDIAAIIVRADLARATGFTDRSHSADATYVDQILSLPRPTIRVGKIEKTLAVHN